MEMLEYILCNMLMFTYIIWVDYGHTLSNMLWVSLAVKITIRVGCWNFLLNRNFHFYCTSCMMLKLKAFRSKNYTALNQLQRRIFQNTPTDRMFILFFIQFFNQHYFLNYPEWILQHLYEQLVYMKSFHFIHVNIKCIYIYTNKMHQ